jgi:hypothetical protein
MERRRPGFNLRNGKADLRFRRPAGGHEIALGEANQATPSLAL